MGTYSGSTVTKHIASFFKSASNDVKLVNLLGGGMANFADCEVEGL